MDPNPTQDKKKDPPPIVAIQGNVLFVRVPLNMPNGEITALGLLQKGLIMVNEYFINQAVAEANRIADEKGKIDHILKTH